MTKKNYLKLLSYFFFVFVVMLISTFVFLTIDFSANSYSTWIDEGNFTLRVLKGAGTESSPYLVSSAEDLASVAYFVKNNSSIYKNKYFELTQNIDLSKHKWIPIGTKSYPFTGNFNGNKYVVSHMDIFVRDHYAGLFGYSTGQISNLMVSGVINGRAAYNYVGGIVGYSTEQIEYVSSNVKINCPKSNYVGGIVGYSSMDILSAYNLAVITGNDYVGGIAGRCRNIALTYNSASSTIKGHDYVAGIVGECYFFTIHSYNLASISGNNYIGGIMGFSSLAKIGNCFNKGTIDGNNCVAGIVAWTSGASLYHEISYVSNSGEIFGNSCVGGIAGLGYGKFSKCYNNGTINGKSINSDETGGIVGFHTGSLSECRNEGRINGSQRSGGIAGRSYNNGQNLNSWQCIEFCSNNGTVTGMLDVGGIVGAADYITINSCYNSGLIMNNTDHVSYYPKNSGGIVGRRNNLGKIDSCYNIGLVYARVNGGGIIGYQDDKQASVVNCFNTGSTSCDLSKKAYIGSICGRNMNNRGSVNNNYFLTGSCSPNTALGTSGGDGTNKSGGESYKVSVSELRNTAMIENLSKSYFKKGNTYPILIKVENEFYDIEDSFKEALYWDTDSAYNNGHPILVNNYWSYV